jgi:hypothetical protein
MLTLKASKTASKLRKNSPAKPLNKWQTHPNEIIISQANRQKNAKLSNKSLKKKDKAGSRIEKETMIHTGVKACRFQKGHKKMGK